MRFGKRAEKFLKKKIKEQESIVLE